MRVPAPLIPIEAMFTHRCPEHDVLVDERGTCGACGSRERLVKLPEPVRAFGFQFEVEV